MQNNIAKTKINLTSKFYCKYPRLIADRSTTKEKNSQNNNLPTINNYIRDLNLKRDGWCLTVDKTQKYSITSVYHELVN